MLNIIGRESIGVAFPRTLPDVVHVCVLDMELCTIKYNVSVLTRYREHIEMFLASERRATIILRTTEMTLYVF